MSRRRTASADGRAPPPGPVSARHRLSRAGGRRERSRIKRRAGSGSSATATIGLTRPPRAGCSVAPRPRRRRQRRRARGIRCAAAGTKIGGDGRREPSLEARLQDVGRLASSHRSSQTARLGALSSQLLSARMAARRSACEMLAKFIRHAGPTMAAPDSLEPRPPSFRPARVCPRLL